MAIEDVIAQQSATIANQMLQIAEYAKSEREVELECFAQIKAFCAKAGVKIAGEFDRTIGSGRPDAHYQGLIIEYKDPSNPATRIGPGSESAGTKAVVKQIKERFPELERELHYPLKRLMGVGCDGRMLVFVRYRDGRWDVENPQPVTSHSVERLLRALISLGAQGKSFTPEYLAADFGSDSDIAQKGVRDLYKVLTETKSKKALTFFSQWKILFGQVCGYDVEGKNTKIQKLGEHYGIPGAQPAELLFAIHTYYAVFMKFLAAEIAGSFSPLGASILKKCVGAPSGATLKREMENVEQGGIWSQLGITNFLEGDLFSWYLDAWDDTVSDAVRGIVLRLDEYDPTTLSVDPNESRDLLKKLYHELFPASVRHDLGEYYTPDWLAEHVLNELGYDGHPDKRLLDPACGSGTFLVMAINRVKVWFDKHRHECGYDEGELVRKVLRNIIGFDLNPLAVMASRTNYLMSLRDLVKHAGSIEIPVYLCDSIMTPAEFASRDLQPSYLTDTGRVVGGAEKPMELRTAVGKFYVPGEVASSREAIGRYAEIIEFCVRNRYSTQEFISRCGEEGLPVAEEALHGDLYQRMVELDADNENGIWARIIKNAFAPLFTARVDFVAGNPPWVFWNNLPGEYREQVRHLMADTYRITAKRASTMKRLGAAGKDLSMLFFYVGLDKYVAEHGRLGFVITQTLFQTTAGNEFRHFGLPSGEPIRIEKVEDWVKVEPFRPKAGNKTAIVVATRGAKTTYPIQYDVWTAKAAFDRESASLSTVLAACIKTAEQAEPYDASDMTSFWVIGGATYAAHERSEGDVYRARLGIETKLEGVYRVEILGQPEKGKTLVRNVVKRVKIPVPVVTRTIEDSLLLPYVTGASLSRWTYDVAGYYVVPHTAETGMAPIPESEMKRAYRLTYDFFALFEEALRRRSIHQRWGRNNPFYSMYNIGPYTFARYRVAWKRSTKNFAAAVISSVDDPALGTRTLVADGNVMIVPFEEDEPAFFLCGILNSAPARWQINRSITTKAHRDIINVVPLEKFRPSDPAHRHIVRLARRCHQTAAEGDWENLAALEAQIDDAAANLWGMTEDELGAIQASLKESESGKRGRRLTGSDGDCGEEGGE